MSLKFNEDILGIVNNFEKRIGIREGNNNNNINGALSFEFYDIEKNDTIFRLTRYDWKKFLNWIQTFNVNFEVNYHINYYNDNFNFGTGIVLLNKKGNTSPNKSIAASGADTAQHQQ